jgi:hypothetical protein
MESKEWILKKHILAGQKELGIVKDTDFKDKDWQLTVKYLSLAMQEYSDQQNKALLDEITDLKSRLEISEQQKILNYNCLVDANKEIADLKIRLEIWRGDEK